MAEIFSNEVLSTTLQNVYTGLSGLTQVAVRQRDRLTQQINDRLSGDQALSSRITNLQSNVTTNNGKLGADINYISGALDTEVSNRETAVSDALTSAKTYVDESLENYYTSTQVDDIKTSIETNYKAYADQAEADAVNTAAGDATSKANKALEDAKAYADQAEADAISTAAADATSKTDKALADAKTYADATSGFALTEAKAYTDVASSALKTANDALSTYIGNLEIVKCDTLIDSTNNEAEYALVDKAGKQFGTRINVTKDRFLSDVSYDTETRALSFTFKLADGTDKVESVEIGDLVDTYTAGDGLKVENNVFSAVKDEASESYLDITSAGIKVSGIDSAISAAIATETSARIEAIEDINEQISTINAQLGLGDGGADGESLTDRVGALEEALPIEAVSGGALLTVISGKPVLNSIYNPGIALQFNGKSVGSGITSLNFAGTTTITVGENGVAKVQIGENMNSSVWNAKDGKNGDGTVTGFPGGSSIIIPDATDATFKVGNWTAGTAYSVGSTSSSFTVSSTDVIHMDEGTNTWVIKVYGATGNVLVEANVNDIVTYNDASNPTSATVTKSAISYVTGSAGINHTVESGSIEPNYPAAVGGCAKVKFTFDLTAIDEVKNGGRYSIEISGCGGTYKSAERFYVAGTTPSIGSITLQQKENTSYTEAIYSGVKYITAGNFVTSITNIKNVWNQAAVANSLTTTGITGLANVDTNVAATSITASNKYDSVGNYTDDSITLATNYAGEKVTVNFNIKNAKTNANGTPASITGLNINTCTGTGTTAAIQTFVNESKRLGYSSTALSATFTNTDNLSGNSELQIIPGTGLKYPQKDYSKIATPANNPNYGLLSTSTDTRYFVREFVNGSGTCTSVEIYLKGLATDVDTLSELKDVIATLEIHPISQATTTLTSTKNWYNCLAYRGGADAFGIFNSVSYDKTNNWTTVSLTLPGTDNHDGAKGMLLRIGLTNKSTTISYIQVKSK